MNQSLWRGKLGGCLAFGLGCLVLCLGRESADAKGGEPATNTAHLSIQSLAGEHRFVPVLSAGGPDNRVYRLESSRGFSNWMESARTHDGLWPYPDRAQPFEGARFYRLQLRDKTEDDVWKNQILFPGDDFLSPEFGISLDEVRWLKFALMLDEPWNVYFQHSRQYLFHYDFATSWLEPFLGMSPAEFDQVSLYTNQQQVLLGTVLYPPPPNTAEFGIQFVGQDAYAPEFVLRHFRRVAEVVAHAPGVRALYMPTFEQAEVAQDYRDYFATNGLSVSSTARWLTGNQCYAEGWAVGRLVFVRGEEIEDAYAGGILLPGDVLLTDAVPAEIPYLAGVLSLAPSTPNSHVAILARSYGMPFVHLSQSEDQAWAQGLVGRKVGVVVESNFEGCRVKLLDLEQELNPELERILGELKTPKPLNIQSRASYGALTALVDDLMPSDVRYFGGKAANYGFLRREIPESSRPALAISFDLWDAFLRQPFAGETSLGAAISNRLSGYVYPPDVAGLRADLDDIRDWIRDGDFTLGQRTEITNALAMFDPLTKIRFRSSTNFEDTEETVGAGLYDSYSGCLADDLDGDEEGPSHCDPMEDEERGVFRAIKRVLASFYNDNAYLERLRYGVVEDQVGMAILVHHSFPDETELANGVAALDVQGAVDAMRLNGDLVTQVGAVPVTNPEGGALPEVVALSRSQFGSYVFLQERSSLAPLGAYVLDWQDDYLDLAQMFVKVTRGYRLAHPGRDALVMDFEYKKIAGEGLVVKQVREIPSPYSTNSIVPFLFHVSNRFGIFQGERGTVFGNHRLKSLWQPVTRSLQVSDSNLETGIYLDGSHQWAWQGEVRLREGAPETWPEAEYRLEEQETREFWSEGSGAGAWRFELKTRFVREVAEDEPPLFCLEDYDLEWWATYGTPQPEIDYQGRYGTVTEDVVFLAPLEEVDETSLYQQRSITNGPVVVDIRFYWPDPPNGAVAGYTAPLVAWDETVITGLIAEPIVLRGYFSQTYRPGHHNFTEEFIFEPRLEEGIAPEILQALEQANIQWIHVVWGLRDAVLTVKGLDGKLRVWP